MGIVALVRASLAAAVGCAVLSMSGPAEAAQIGQPWGFAAFSHDAAEPFGLARAELGVGALKDKWLALTGKLADEHVQLALCDGDRERCASPAALRLLAIVDQGRLRQGRARLGEINRAVNLAIRPVSDLVQYGQMDVWSSPLVTFDRGAGDCEDYAIAKFLALRLAGITADDLRIVILHDVSRNEDHAILAARLEGRWLMLDNQRMAMIQDADARQVHPLVVMGENDISNDQAAPSVADATNRSLAALGTVAAAE